MPSANDKASKVFDFVITAAAGKEPAWDRNQRKQRQQDRGLLHAHKQGLVQLSAASGKLAVQSAALRLEKHHGSSAGKWTYMVPTPRGSNGSDWSCKRCKDKTGKPFVNWAVRSSCLLCRVHKGQCYGGDVKDISSSPTKSLAQRQTEQGRHADKQQHKQQQLRKENESLKQEVEKLKGAAGDKEQPEKPEEKSRLRDLERHRALYAKLPGEEQKVKELDCQIQQLKGARSATFPAGEQLKRAEQALAKKKKKRQTVEQDIAELQQRLAERQEELTSVSAEERAAEQELERIRNSISSAAARGPSNLAGLAEGWGEWLKVLPKDILEQQGLDEGSIAAFCGLCQKFAACGEAAKVASAAVEEAAEKETKERADAAAKERDSADVHMEHAHAGHPADVNRASATAVRAERSRSAAEVAADDLEELCKSSSPEEAAAAIKCKELLAARAAKRTKPY